MQSIESNALEPTKAELSKLAFVSRVARLVPVYGLVLLTIGLIVLFSILLPDTFPTMLNLRAILSDKSIIALLSLAATIPMVAGRIDLTAGDGSESAYQRIRAGQYQAVTVAEPLNLQGWQLVDELNRAMLGAEWSGYNSPLHVVTVDNISFDGGDRNIFDPDNGYREEYAKIWSFDSSLCIASVRLPRRARCNRV